MKKRAIGLGFPRDTIDLVSPPTTKRRRTVAIDLDSPLCDAQTLTATDCARGVHATDCSLPSPALTLQRTTAIPVTAKTFLSFIDLSDLTQPGPAIDLSQGSAGTASDRCAVINLSQIDSDLEQINDGKTIRWTDTQPRSRTQGVKEMPPVRDSTGKDHNAHAREADASGDHVEGLVTCVTGRSSRLRARNIGDTVHSGAEGSMGTSATAKSLFENEHIGDAGHSAVEGSMGTSAMAKSLFENEHIGDPGHSGAEGSMGTSATAKSLFENEHIGDTGHSGVEGTMGTSARAKSPSENAFIEQYATGQKVICRSDSEWRASTPTGRGNVLTAVRGSTTQTTAKCSVEEPATVFSKKAKITEIHPVGEPLVGVDRKPRIANNCFAVPRTTAVDRKPQMTEVSATGPITIFGRNAQFAENCPAVGSRAVFDPQLQFAKDCSATERAVAFGSNSQTRADSCAASPVAVVGNLETRKLQPTGEGYPSLGPTAVCGNSCAPMRNNCTSSGSAVAFGSISASIGNRYPLIGSAAACGSASPPIGIGYPPSSSAEACKSASAPTGNGYPPSSSAAARGSAPGLTGNRYPLIGSTVACGSASAPIGNGYPPSSSAEAFGSTSALRGNGYPPSGSAEARGSASAPTENGYLPLSSTAACGRTFGFTANPYTSSGATMAGRSVSAPSENSCPFPGSAASRGRTFASTDNPYTSSGSTTSAFRSTIAFAGNTYTSSGTVAHSGGTLFAPSGVRLPPAPTTTCHSRSDVHRTTHVQNATTGMSGHENTHYYEAPNGDTTQEATANKTVAAVAFKGNLGFQMLPKAGSAMVSGSTVTRGETEVAPAISGRNAIAASFSRNTAAAPAISGVDAAVPPAISDANVAAASAQREEKKRERLARCEDIDCYRTIRREGTGKIVTEKVSIEEIEALAPVTVKPGLFPEEFADDILKEFLQVQWKQGRRWLIDKEIVAHRLSTGFTFQRLKKEWERSGFADLLRHAGVVLTNNVQRLNHADPRSGFERLKRACGNQPVITLKHLAKYLPSKMRAQWKPDFCVCNYYVDANDFLGAHSDPVQGIGPYAIVAAVTFGGARQFRLKPVFDYKIPGVGTLTGIGIRLPHNSLCVMWEGTQEFWRHEVPKDHHIIPHPLAGQGRLSFTFRQRAFRHLSKAPMCKCNSRAVMKPVFKKNSNFGRYFWSCNNPRRKGEYLKCDFFQWDDDVS